MGGKEDNDYGNGFYTTEYEDRARSWAGLNGAPETSYVNIYHLDIDNLKVMDLNDHAVQNQLIYQENGGYQNAGI